MTTVELLEKARELIAAPGGWTQRSTARDANGYPADYDTDDAVQFCMGGACDRALIGQPYSFDYSRILDAAVEGDYVDWNDEPGRTQAEAVEALDRAIQIARTEEGASRQ